MAVTETKTVKGISFTARRLDLTELRACLEMMESRSRDERSDLLEYLIEDPIPKEVFYLSLGITEKDLAAPLDEGDVVILMEMVAKVNPTFAAADKRYRRQTVDRVSRLQGLLNSARTLSSSASATSGNGTTPSSRIH